MSRSVRLRPSEGAVAQQAPASASWLLAAADRLAVAFAATFFAALGFLALNEPWVSDDFSGAIFLRDHPGLWECVSYGYRTWTGRFTSSAFSWLVMQVRPVYGLVIWLGIVMLVVLTFAVGRGRLPRIRRADLYVLALLALAYWYGMPALEETVFWAAGSVVYLWPAVFALGFVYRYRRWDRDARGPARGRAGEALAALGMLVFGAWVGASQEQVLVACLLYLGVVIWRAARTGRLREMPAELYTGALGLVVAGSISLAAPGNGARLAATPGEGVISTLIGALKYLVHMWVEWLPPLLPWLACLLVLAVPIAAVAAQRGTGDGGSQVRSDWWVWVLLGFATVSPLMVKPFFGAERTIAFLAVFLAVAAVSLGNAGGARRVLEALPPIVASFVVATLLVLAAADAGLSGWQARSLRIAQAGRAASVAEMRREGMRDITVPAITDDQPRRGVMWGDGTSDSSFWINGILATWYGVDSVVVSGPPTADTR